MSSGLLVGGGHTLTLLQGRPRVKELVVKISSRLDGRVGSPLEAVMGSAISDRQMVWDRRAVRHGEQVQERVVGAGQTVIERAWPFPRDRREHALPVMPFLTPVV